MPGVGRQHVQMTPYRVHLLGSRLLQVVVDFLGVFSVFGASEAHALHLAALGIQRAMDILQGLLDAVPVHHMLAVQCLPNLVQIRQGHHGMFRAQLLYPSAGRYFAGQLVQVGKEVADHRLVTRTDGIWRHMNVAQHIRPVVRKVQVILQDPHPCHPERSRGISKYILLRQSSQSQQRIPLHYGGELLRRSQVPGNLRRGG